jgi:hypothetical protein
MMENYNRRWRRTPKSVPIKGKFNCLLPAEDKADAHSDTGTVEHRGIRYTLNPNSIHRRAELKAIGWLQLHAIWCLMGGIIRDY